MRTFFRRTGVKAVCALLCIACLTLAVFSGAGAGVLLWNNGYATGPSGLYRSMAQAFLRDDAQRILGGYFDPDDPTHPWRSYYSGGIYDGTDSNFIYRITDYDTGDVMLSTYTGAPSVLASYSQRYYHESVVEVEAAADAPDPVYELTEPLFLWAGDIYAYNRESDMFEQVYDENLMEYLYVSAVELPPGAPYAGFEYQGQFYTWSGDGIFYPADPAMEVTYQQKAFTIDAYVRSDLSAHDRYWELWSLTDFLYGARYGLAWLFALTLALGVGLLVLLCCTVGRKNGTEEIVLNPLFRIPTDVALALAFILFCIPLGLGLDISAYPTRSSLALVLTGWGICALTMVTLGVYTIAMLCARGRKGILWSGTLLRWLWKNAGRLLRAMGRGLGRLAGYVPLLWKVGLCYLAICLFEFLVLMYDNAYGTVVFLWFVGRLICGALVMYIALAFLRLKTGAETIAAGDYSAQVEETHLILDFKDTARTLNHIRDGMNAAVDDRIRSERMKTELITNVSHDLKTPLTSIVSYVDLLKQELNHTQSVTQEAEEYIDVLDRQSARLKKLIEDLVEASKASTGNLALQMEQLDFCLLLNQALGEYSQKLSEANLTLMTQLPDAPIYVWADGRRLWRVFDNLLNNAVKYAMPGTRLYLTVDTGDNVTATFRNISREPLTVSADELLERFVRGDASRHEEGSGLGLSIARSLTESMGGQFGLSLDGDLFKAEVAMPVMKVPELEQK